MRGTTTFPRGVRPAQILFPFLVVLVFLVGCKGRRANSPDADLRGMDKEKAIASHQSSQPQFNVLTLKGKADYEDLNQGQSIGFAYRIDIAKDSLILISASKFGIPGMTMLLSQDTVRIRVPMNNTAAICDYQFFQKMVGMDFDLIKFQDFLLGNARLEEPVALTSGKGNPIILEGTRPPYSVSWILNSRHFRLEKVAFKAPNLPKESELTYSDFEKVNGQMIASTLLMEVTQPQKVRIELHHTAIAIDNEKVDFRFKIPASYKITPCDQMAPKRP